MTSDHPEILRPLLDAPERTLIVLDIEGVLHGEPGDPSSPVRPSTFLAAVNASFPVALLTMEHGVPLTWGSSPWDVGWNFGATLMDARGPPDRTTTPKLSWRGPELYERQEAFASFVVLLEQCLGGSGASHRVHGDG